MTCWQPSKRIAALRLPRKSHHRLEIVTLCHCVSMGFVSKVVRGMYIHCGHAKVVWVTMLAPELPGSPAVESLLLWVKTERIEVPGGLCSN